MQIQKMKIGHMKWFGGKQKVKCPYCGKEFTFTLKEITYGFLYPESIKCKFCDNFIELKESKPSKEKFEALFNEAIKDKGYQFLSDKSTAYYWYKKGMEERL